MTRLPTCPGVVLGCPPVALSTAICAAVITAVPARPASAPRVSAVLVSIVLLRSPAAAGLVVMVAVDAETIYPAQTAANLLAYDRGYFSPGQLARFNLITLAAAAAVVVLVALPWWSLVGLPGG